MRTTNPLSFLLLLLFGIVPLCLGLVYALLYSFGLVGVLNHGFTTANWTAAFSNNEVLFSFLYTVCLSLISLSLCVSAGMFFAIYFGKQLKRGFASYTLYLPMAFPSIVTAFFFFQFLSNAGILSRIFYQLGFINDVTQFTNLVNDRYSIGIILAQFFSTLPVFILLYLAIIINEDLARLQVLASTLGADKGYILRKITLPLLLKKSMPSILLFFIFKLGSYEIPLILGRSSPETISVLIVRKMQRFNLMDIPQGYAIAVIYAFFVLALLIITLKPSKISLDV